MDDETTRAIEALTASQFGLITRAQMRELKLSDNQIKRILGTGRLRRIRSGVFVVVGAPDSWERGLLAAIFRAGDDAVASHSAAAKLWGFRYAPEPRYELTVPRSKILEIDGVRIHRSRHL